MERSPENRTGPPSSPGRVHPYLFEGVLIATASLFLARRLGNFDFLSGLGIRIGTIAGLLLALRWVSDILFAPGIGWMADRLGQVRSLVVLICVLLVSLMGAVNFSGPLLVLFLAFLFVSSAGLNVTLNAQANALSTQMERPHIYLGFMPRPSTGARPWVRSWPIPSGPWWDLGPLFGGRRRAGPGHFPVLLAGGKVTQM